jgi:hypothetical protein
MCSRGCCRLMKEAFSSLKIEEECRQERRDDGQIRFDNPRLNGSNGMSVPVCSLLAHFWGVGCAARNLHQAD